MCTLYDQLLHHMLNYMQTVLSQQACVTFEHNFLKDYTYMYIYSHALINYKS